MEKELIKEIEKHLQNAKLKHPFFASCIMNPNPFKKGKVDKKIVEFWKDMAKITKTSVPSVELILIEEIYEIYQAVAEGDINQAKYEIFDAIAVLLRLHENIEELYAQMRRP